MNRYTQHKRKNSKIVTQIGYNEYLVEGTIDYLRLGFVTDPIISYADIDGGPYLEVGKDFFGKGIIDQIELIDDSSKDYIMIKVILQEPKNNE